jgi:NTE family protein
MFAKRLVLVVLAAVAAGEVRAEAAAVPADPPGLVLVLSGGGARGAAHIGVLKVLEELHVVPDMVVGTSMGSIVGGLYAAGWSPAEIEVLLNSVDWNSVFSDSVRRSEKSFRRKQDYRPQMIPTKLRFRGLKPYIPPGVLGGQSLELLLRSLEMETTGESDFDRLPIPYRAVAMDIATGEAVVIGDGSLATAMRASMSIPGAFPPVERDGRKLVDGGAAANLPVGIAQKLGAKHVIAVDISSPLAGDSKQFADFLSVFSQLNSILTVSNRMADVDRLGESDVLIVPELGDISFVSFERATEAVGIGEKSAREKIDALRAFAVDDAAWAAFRARQRVRPVEETVIDSVRVENSSPVSDALVKAALTIAPGDRANDATLRPALLRLYNLDYFGVIKPRLEPLPDGAHELVVPTPEPLYGRNRLQLGLAFGGDLEGSSEYALTLRHQMLAVNRRGGEWQNVLQFGDVALLELGFYQPLDAAMKWFVQPRVSYRRELQDFWVDGQAISEYTTWDAEARLEAGRVLGSWGEIRAGAFYSSDRFENRIGLPAFPDFSTHRGAGMVTFRIDTDSARAFPRHGGNVLLRYTKSAESLGSDDRFEQVYGRGAWSVSFGESTVRPEIEYGDNLAEDASIFSLFSLGGPAHLSGLARDELLGERVAYGSLTYFHRLKKVDLAGIHVRFFAGGALEAGDVFRRDEALTADTLQTGWSVFVGADTPMGPALITYGNTGGRGRLYLAIGDRY